MASVEKSLTQVVIGYTAMAASVGIGAYITSHAVFQLYKAFRLRRMRERAEAEAMALRENPRQFTPAECARTRSSPRLRALPRHTPRSDPRGLCAGAECRLASYNGKDPSHCLFIAVKGRILDVHELGHEFYGPEGPYKHLAGKDGSRALALMSLKAEDATDSLADLTPEQLQTLDDWAKKLYEKYPTVGMLVAEQAPAAESS